MRRTYPASGRGADDHRSWEIAPPRTHAKQEHPMATISASMFMALDGVVDPMVGNWHFPYFNDEMGEAVGGTHEADVMLFGRVTYDSFAGAWPEREAAGGGDAPPAEHPGGVSKNVAPPRPPPPTWGNPQPP